MTQSPIEARASVGGASAKAPPEDGEVSGGLSSLEAEAKLREVGPNTIPEVRQSQLRAFGRKLMGPVPWMLEAALVLELVLGRRIEAVIIGSLVLVNAALSFFQEQRAERALAVLRSRLTIVARVHRDGAWTQRPASNVVPGDLVYVRMGDVVPADLRLVQGRVLLDQSTLTGESAPVEALANAPAFAGSVVRQGEASGQVVATGTRTSYGRTAELVRVARTASHLQELVVGIVRYLVAFDGALAAAVLLGARLVHLSSADVIPFALMLIIASVPVALPATFTLAGALGALDLSRHGVLVTRLSAIEEAASMEVLCSDKTGTLTENRLTLVELAPRPPWSHAELVRIAAMTCDRATQDPLDLAILGAMAQDPVPLAERQTFTPFDPATKRAEATIIERGQTVRLIKGAPQAVVATLSHPIDLTAEVDRLAKSAGRVLAVARGDEAGVQLCGLLGFRDPPRPEAKGVIEALRKLGVRVLMVTGDTEATARAVASELAIGSRIRSVDRQGASPLDYDVFAGVLPEDKFRLVESIQSQGQIVGMTGDGVNDAPALKQAEVGIAVSSATDVAKAAASLVLTSPGLSGVVAAVETSRRIYQRMLTYTVNKIVKTLHVALFLSAGLFVTGGLVTTPRHILLLIFTNDFVTMSLASDHVKPSNHPDRWNVPALVRSSLLIAVGWVAFSLGVVEVSRRALHLGLEEQQTLAFLMLVFGGQANVYLVRERRSMWSSAPSGWMLLASGLDLLLVSGLAIFGVLMEPVAPIWVLALLGAVIAFTALLDLVKVALFRRSSRGWVPLSG